jgi:L-lactate dehydrogenase (cytochrome)/(S)-mandelate dehydrogenase
MKPYNTEGYRLAARRALPHGVFDFVDGGAEDEVSLRANRDAFETMRLRYRIHENQDPVDLSTSICGQPMSMPVMLSPVGNSGLIHPAGDLGMAQVAARMGLIMVMSGVSSYTIDEVASAVDRKPWYQLYPLGSREVYTALIDRAADAGFPGLVVTIDVPGPANRERDVANSFSGAAFRLDRHNIWDIVRHPRWMTGVLKERRIVVRAFSDRTPALLSLVREAKQAAALVTHSLFRPTWDELAWIRERWQGPFGIKGIVDPGDARRAIELGADIIYVSNHGGRQLDGAPAALEALPAIVDAVGGRAEIVLDGGIRRGTDVIKALCLGARAVSVGRPWAYGLAVGGSAGGQAVLECLNRELMISMNLLGTTTVQALDRSFLIPSGVPECSHQ